MSSDLVLPMLVFSLIVVYVFGVVTW